ncbi:uncharacterized protein LOC110852598 isoform X4 [Folsomia candida]|uniref:uncharacterized protein LOC110852598 isoform X4 n=1 Tax=Folsomia candida TaxID=158441 RepID=UPI001604B6D3|nr:uncharacterized protein LOC110852598 isoform X4 [Folsomia candida]
MGKKKSDIYSCFQILAMKNKANKSIFMCKFCDRQYLQNATKMESHIVTQCQKVPHQVRLAYAKVPPGVAQEYNNNLGAGGAVANSRPSPSLSSDNSSIESRPETPVNVNYHQKSQRPSPGNNYYTATSSSGGSGTSLVIKRAGGTLVSDLVPSSPRQQSNKKPKLDNNNVITLNANQVRSLMANNNNNNNNNLSNHNLTKYVQAQQQKQRQQQQQQHQNQLYLQQSNAKRGAQRVQSPQTGGIHIKAKHMVPTSTAISNQRRAHQGNGGTNSVGRTNVVLAKVSSGGNVGGLAVTPVPVGVEAFPKTFNHKELVEVWNLLARAVYSTGCPLSLFENEHWKAAFKKIRPGLTLPTTDAVSNSLLKAEYTTIKKKLEHSIESLNFVTVHCLELKELDGATFLSFFINCSTMPSLYRVIRLETGQEIDTGKFSSTLDAIGPQKVLAFVGGCSLDHQGVSKTWDSLRFLYPGLITYGCISQGLNSLLNYILGLDRIHKLCLKGKSLVSETKSNPELKKRFQEIQRELKLAPVPAFKFSSRSSWASLVKCVALLVSQKEAFQALIQESKEEFCRNEKEDLNLSPTEGSMDLASPEFWSSLTSVTNLIVPLSNWIKTVEGGSCIGQIPVILRELKEAFASNVDNIMVLDQLEKESLKTQLNIVRRLCMNELHLAACLLNPQNRNVLTSNEEEEAAEFIHFFCETFSGFQAEAALPQLSDYRNKVGDFSVEEELWSNVDSTDPLEWWRSLFFQAYPLAEVASHLLQIPSNLCTLTLPSTFNPKSLYMYNTTSPPMGDDTLEKLALVRYYMQKSTHDNPSKSNPLQMQMQVQVRPLNQPKVNGEKNANSTIVNGEGIFSAAEGGQDQIEGITTSIGRKINKPNEPALPHATIISNGRDPEPDFRLEDQEPMDVTHTPNQMGMDVTKCQFMDVTQFLRQKTETSVAGFEGDGEDDEEEDGEEDDEEEVDQEDEEINDNVHSQPLPRAAVGSLTTEELLKLKRGIVVNGADEILNGIITKPAMVLAHPLALLIMKISEK